MYYYNRDCYRSKQRSTSDIFINGRNRTTRVHSQVSVELSTGSRNYPQSKQRAAIPQFTSLRKMAKPKNDGITIVNVYNCDKKREKKRQKYLFPEEAIPAAPPPKRIEVPKRAPREGYLDKICLVTDQDRFYALKPQKILPNWHQVEEKCDGNELFLDDYDTEKARRDWQMFYAEKAREKTGKSCCNQDCCCGCADGEANQLVERRMVEEKRLERMKNSVKIRKEETKVEVSKEAKECHAANAFYGTVETQKLCDNAIKNLTKAEKDLNQLAFISNTVFPQSAECIKKLIWIREALKLYHTNVRELQNETDEKLQKKNGCLAIKVLPPPRHDLPFPKHTY